MAQINRETWVLNKSPAIISDFAHLQKKNSDQFYLVRVKHFELILNRYVIITLIIVAE